MASAQVVETSATNNSPSQDSNHSDDLLQSGYDTYGFKPFLFNCTCFEVHKKIICAFITSITNTKSFRIVKK